MFFLGKVTLELFFSVIEGFHTLNKIADAVKAYIIRKKMNSNLLHQLVTPGKQFPDLKELLNYFDNAIDKELSKKSKIYTFFFF